MQIMKDLADKTISAPEVQSKTAHTSRPKRSGIPGRVGIDYRPDVADMSTEIRCLERDTVICFNDIKIIIMTRVDNASKYLLAGLAQDPHNLNHLT
jgi:IS30 family transposase